MSAIQYYYDSGKHIVLTLDERRINEAAIEKRISYINRTHDEIVLCERSNLKFVLPPNPFFQKEHEVIVRIEYFINSEKVKNNTQLILDRLQNISEHLGTYRDAFSFKANERQYGGIDFIVEYSIDIDTINNLGKTIYFKELDILLSLKTYDECPNHPYSEEEDISSIYSDLEELNGLNLSIELICNDNSHSDRFVNILGRIYRIKTNDCVAKKNGVYFKAFNENRIQHNKYNLDGEDELNTHFFKTYDDALTYGAADIIMKKKLLEQENVLVLVKKELETLKSENQIREAEFEREKLNLEKEKIKFKEKYEKEEYERKLRLETHKDDYDRKSIDRKNTSETIKVIPQLIIGLGALALGIKSIFF